MPEKKHLRGLTLRTPYRATGSRFTAAGIPATRRRRCPRHRMFAQLARDVCAGASITPRHPCGPVVSARAPT